MVHGKVDTFINPTNPTDLNLGGYTTFDTNLERQPSDGNEYNLWCTPFLCFGSFIACVRGDRDTNVC